ncbi:MAG: NAD(P)/FAD-dependent oxidoreductase [Planctomycetota bacterium]
MATHNPSRAAIIGCGPGGQAAAAMLARAGWAVDVFERSPRLDPIGAGLLLQPTGLAVLDDLDVGEPIRNLAAPIDALLGTTRAGRTAMRLSYADLRDGSVGLGVQRTAIANALQTAMHHHGVALHTGVDITDIAHTPNGPAPVTHSGEQLAAYQLAVVASGARSPLRTKLARARRDRQYPWAALWFIGDDPNGRFTGTLRQVYDGTTQMIGFLPSGRAAPEAPNKVSFFWSLRVTDWQGPDALDLNRFKDTARALARFAEPLIDQLESADQLVFAPYRDVILASPVLPDRGIALIGDAAHAMSPQLGQGVNLALLDAQTLAAHASPDADLPAALTRFARARRKHNAFYSLASRWLTPFFQSDQRWLAPPRDLLLPAMCRVPWTRRQMLLSLKGVKTGPFTTRRETHQAPRHIAATRG